MAIETLQGSGLKANRLSGITRNGLLKAAFPGVAQETGISIVEQELPYRPVDIAVGHKELRKMRTTAALIRDNLLPSQPFGEQTRTKLINTIDEFTEVPGSVVITNDPSTLEYVNSGRRNPEKDYRLSLTPHYFRNLNEYLSAVAELDQLPLTSEQIEQIGYIKGIGHELGHALQEIYGGDRATLTLDAFRHGIREPLYDLTEDSVRRYVSVVAENEAFGEGFGQMLAADYAATYCGLNDDQAEMLHSRMTSPGMVYDYQFSLAYIGRVFAGNLPLATVHSEVRPHAAKLGYGNPYSREDVHQVLRLTT